MPPGHLKEWTTGNTVKLTVWIVAEHQIHPTDFGSYDVDTGAQIETSEPKAFSEENCYQTVQ